MNTLSVTVTLLLGLVYAAPVPTSVTNTPALASTTTVTATPTCPPDSNIFESLHLTEDQTWATFFIVWAGFLIGFIQCCFIYYLCTHRRSRDCNDKPPDESNKRRAPKAPRRLCFFEWGHTRRDFEAYFWDPEGYGKRRYKDQEAHTIHRTLARWLGRSFGSKELGTTEQVAPDASEKTAASRSRHDHHPSKVRLVTSSDEMILPNVSPQQSPNPTTIMFGALEYPRLLHQLPCEKFRRRNITVDRATAQNAYSRTSIQEAASTARDFSPNTTDYYDALDEVEKAKGYLCQSTEGFNGTVRKRAYTTPIPATLPEIEKSTRAASEGSNLAKEDCSKPSDLTPIVYTADAHEHDELKYYEAESSIDAEVSSRGSSNETISLPTPRAEKLYVAGKWATNGATRLSHVPQLGSSAAINIPKTRSPVAKPSTSLTASNPPEQRSCLNDNVPPRQQTKLVPDSAPTPRLLPLLVRAIQGGVDEPSALACRDQRVSRAGQTGEEFC